MLQARLDNILEMYKREKLIVGYPSEISKACKLQNYLAEILTCSDLTTLIIAETPYPKDICGTYMSAFSYSQEKQRSPPLSVRALAEALAAHSRTPQEAYTNLLRDNYSLSKEGIHFLDIYPLHFHNPELRKQDKHRKARINQLNLRYARKIADVLTSHYCGVARRYFDDTGNLHFNSDTFVCFTIPVGSPLELEIFTFGNIAKSLLPDLYDRLLTFEYFEIDLHSASHPARSRWKPRVLQTGENVRIMKRLTEILTPHIVEETIEDDETDEYSSTDENVEVLDNHSKCRTIYEQVIEALKLLVLPRILNT